MSLLGTKPRKGTEEGILKELLRTNQMQMELLAEMTKTLGKVADLLVPSGPPEALTGRFAEEWTLKGEDSDGAN